MLTATIIALGIFGFRLLPVSALPKVDFPTIAITATLPGASPDTMAASVAGPIERQLSTISGISSMTSQSSQGTTSITIQFDLNRNIDAAALDVQTALTIAQRRLPVEMTTPPSFRKVNPSDFPILFIALSSATLPLSTVHEYADIVHRRRRCRRFRRRPGAGLRRPEVRRPRPGRSGSRRGARAVDGRHPHRGGAGQFDDAGRHAERAQPERHAAGVRASSTRPRTTGTWWSPGATARRSSSTRSREIYDSVENDKTASLVQRQPRDRAGDPEAARRQHGRGGRRGQGALAGAAGADCRRRSRSTSRWTGRSRSGSRCSTCRRR